MKMDLVDTGELLTDRDGREVVVADDGTMAPVVGELSAKTRPEDFRRFEAIAAAWWAAHDPNFVRAA
jgi:hypothetical protein